jgi:2-aminoethylphosphonate-pyruvate transaminase
VTLVHNPHYATTGSLLSLSRGLATVSGACVILESDLIYAPQALEIIDGKRNVLVTSGPTGAGDEVYIWTRSAPGGPEHLVTMSKQIDALDGPHFGELVGITGLTADAVEALREVTLRELERDPAEHYEPGLVALTRDFPIEVERIDDLPWAEVDDEAMLARAERLVYPQVMAARAKSAIFEIPGATQGKVGLNPPYSA